MTSVLQRLSKYLSHSGVASRRKSEEIIRSGRVLVNNIKILEPQHLIDQNKDTVKVDNRLVSIINAKIYIALNKPVGYLSDMKDPANRKLARNLINIDTKIFPVGRLDYNSEGLILFTNDGDFAYRIMHPKFNVEKEYLVKFKDRLSNDDFAKLKKGITIDGTVCKISDIGFVKASIKNNWYRLIINEGRNRIIRKIGERIGHHVLKLKRIRIGNIKLADLEPGQYRFLNDNEIRPFKMPPD